MTRKPWLKFHPADWLTDVELRSCSSAERGTLIDLMCIAHRSEPYGVCLPDSEDKTLRRTAKLLSISPKTFGNHVANLRRMSRICEQDDGSLCIKRMVRDDEYSRKQSENGAKGGNPDITRVNPSVKPEQSRGDQSKAEPPISPKGDGGSPKRKPRRLSDTDKRKLRVPENTKQMVAVGGLFNRREDTLWNQYEADALEACGMTRDEFLSVRRYYTAKIPPGDDIRRRNVETLLNNWTSEVDRAAGWEAQNASRGDCI